jgi:hypothetical protein
MFVKLWNILPRFILDLIWETALAKSLVEMARWEAKAALTMLIAFGYRQRLRCWFCHT